MMSERSGKDARYRRVHVRWYSAIKPPPSSLFPSSRGRQKTSDGTKFNMYIFIYTYMYINQIPFPRFSPILLSSSKINDNDPFVSF